MINKLLIFLGILISAACFATEGKQVIPVNTGHEDVATALRAKLTKEGIWFRDIDKVTLEISLPVPADIFEFLNKQSEKILPKNRSGSWPKPMFMEIRNQLGMKKIKFKTVFYDNSYWLVWSENDVETVDEIISKVARNQNIQESKESDYYFELE